MRTTRQVAIYCIIKEGRKGFFVLLKRSNERGGFWQPVTGGEEDFDDGDLRKSAMREIQEELGINVTEEQIMEIPYSFRFTDQKGIEHEEQCFGIILEAESRDSIKLSDEHTSIIYSTDLDYLKSLLKFEENRIGLGKFNELIAAG